jgi:N-methylhydantoinase A
MVDVHTVGAGGGSIGWRDSGGALRVGPRSAGAQPGPACYGRGGEEPTVTDADLLLGRLAGDSTLAGDVELDRDAAARAVGRLAGELGLEPLEAAEGIVRIADQEMIRALRVVTVERGIDPRRFALLPFGGAGPMHAAAIAAELGIGEVICPRAGGVLSALGLCASERRRDTARTVMLAGENLNRRRVGAEVREMTDALGEPGAEAEPEVVYELRYAGQAFELPVPGPPDPDPRQLIAGFERAHEERYGHTDPDGEVVLVAIRLALVSPGPEPHPRASGEGLLRETARRVRFESEWVETTVLRGEPGAGLERPGPVVFELPESTFVIPPGWAARVDEAGSILAAVEGE